VSFFGPCYAAHGGAITGWVAISTCGARGDSLAQTHALGQIVVLNGAPRSGKSSIAAAIQNTFDGVWMNLGVDGFMRMTPPRFMPGMGLRPGGERQDIELLVQTLYRALYESIVAHSREGLNVVVDVGHHDGYAVPRHILPECASRLGGLPALFVGVRCPLETIMERRRDTGWKVGGSADDPAPPPVLLWQREVHTPGIYDLEVDTSVLSPEECAAEIRRQLDDGPPPSAFRRLAGMATTQNISRSDNEPGHS
jgi:chloramphenicol 3-O phosphotransferase